MYFISIHRMKQENTLSKPQLMELHHRWIILFLLPVFDVANHSALWSQRTSVLDVKGLSWNEGEIKPLKQLRYHHFSLHLKIYNHQSGCLSFCLRSRFIDNKFMFYPTHLSKVLSQARTGSKRKREITVIRPGKTNKKKVIKFYLPYYDGF